MMEKVARAHPFFDGNKRTAVILAVYYLEETGHPIPEDFDVDELERLCLEAATGTSKPGLLKRFLQFNWLSIHRR
jgi:prophage maintenance system killer protein